MLKVLLVDDEPFILQGLKVLIDWEAEGFEIAGTATNGEEALKFLLQQKVELIIADINMPGMSGLSLLEKIRNEQISDAYYVILSGYAEFSYAQQAIRYECKDYILKPVEREKIIGILQKIIMLNHTMQEKIETDREMERAYLARNVISLISGKYDEQNLEYVKTHMHLSGNLRYIGIQLDNVLMQEEITDEEKRVCQRKLYQACLKFIKEDSGHCVFDVSASEKIYDIGLVYCDYMAKNSQMDEKKYLENFLAYLRGNVCFPVIMLVGKTVTDISNIARSYGTVGMLRSFLGFRKKKDIYYYEEEVQITEQGIVLCKSSIDVLLKAVEQNNHTEIHRSVDLFYEEMQRMGVNREIMNLNINYFLFQLIHLATEQDNGVNQEEILHIISEGSVEEGIMRGSKAHLVRFACEYGDYLAQLRKNVSRGILGDIEREVREHYAENLTLKELSEKYYVNSAYLGQIFRKKYGQSFKDYLNNYRLEQAASMLLRTDDKIYQIAEAVGYHDLDYFVNRFIAAKGCTPAKFRKQARMVV